MFQKLQLGFFLKWKTKCNTFFIIFNVWYNLKPFHFRIHISQLSIHSPFWIALFSKHLPITEHMWESDAVLYTFSIITLSKPYSIKFSIHPTPSVPLLLNQNYLRPPFKFLHYFTTDLNLTMSTPTTTSTAVEPDGDLREKSLKDLEIMTIKSMQFLKNNMKIHGETVSSFIDSITSRVLFLERDGVCGYNLVTK